MEKTTILIIDSDNGRLSRMAAAFLRSFNKDLYVKSAGIKNEGIIDRYVVKVMEEAGIDITKDKGGDIKDYLSDNWDYLIIINNCANAITPVFTGMVDDRFYININDSIKQEGPEEVMLNKYTELRNHVRTSIFDFFLKDLNGKEILGDDSCSTWCDLP